MGFATFQAFDMSAFHSAQGEGYDCKRPAQGGGTIAIFLKKVEFWDVFLPKPPFQKSFATFWKVEVCGGRVWNFFGKLEPSEIFSDTPSELFRKRGFKRLNFVKR